MCAGTGQKSIAGTTKMVVVISGITGPRSSAASPRPYFPEQEWLGGALGLCAWRGACPGRASLTPRRILLCTPGLGRAVPKAWPGAHDVLAPLRGKQPLGRHRSAFALLECSPHCRSALCSRVGEGQQDPAPGRPGTWRASSFPFPGCLWRGWGLSASQLGSWRILNPPGLQGQPCHPLVYAGHQGLDFLSFKTET